jgi:hypothetical protein
MSLVSKAFFAAVILASFSQLAWSCTEEPNSARIQIYQSPDIETAMTADASARACDMRLTGICAGLSCQTLVDGRFGFVDARALLGSTVAEPIDTWIYQVQSQEGHARFLGNPAPEVLANGAEITLSAAPETLALRLPPPLPGVVTLAPQGDAWEAQLPDWAGAPGPVLLRVTGLGGQIAEIQALSESTFVSMNHRWSLDLRQTRRAEVAPGSVIALLRPAPTDDAAPDLLEFLDAALVYPEPPDDGPNAPLSDCALLQQVFGPVLEGQDTAERQRVIREMDALLITSLDTANPAQCAILRLALGQ